MGNHLTDFIYVGEGLFVVALGTVIIAAGYGAAWIARKLRGAR